MLLYLLVESTLHVSEYLVGFNVVAVVEVRTGQLKCGQVPLFQNLSSLISFISYIYEWCRVLYGRWAVLVEVVSRARVPKESPAQRVSRPPLPLSFSLALALHSSSASLPPSLPASRNPLILSPTIFVWQRLIEVCVFPCWVKLGCVHAVVCQERLHLHMINHTAKGRLCRLQ